MEHMEDYNQKYQSLSDQIDKLMTSYQIAPAIIKDELAARFEERADLQKQFNLYEQARKDYQNAIKVIGDNSHEKARLTQKIEALAPAQPAKPAAAFPQVNIITPRVQQEMPYSGSRQTTPIAPPPPVKIQLNAGSTPPPVVVKSWPPKQNGTQAPKKRSTWKVLGIFAIFAVVITLLLILFLGQLAFLHYIVNDYGGFWLSQAISGAMIGLLTAIIQSLIFRYRLSKQKRAIFILIATLSGILGGLAVALIYDYDPYLPSFLFGIIAGFISGLISSLFQNLLMTSKNKKLNWTVFSTLSWALSCSIGWMISWVSWQMIYTALGVGVIILINGIALAVFIKISPDIEF